MKQQTCGSRAIICAHVQVSLLQQQLQLRTQRGEVKKNAAGEVTDRESRVLVYQISTMMRPIQFDEEETSTLEDSEARYLLLALTNYHRSPTAATAAAALFSMSASHPARLITLSVTVLLSPLPARHCCLAWHHGLLRL